MSGPEKESSIATNNKTKQTKRQRKKGQWMQKYANKLESFQTSVRIDIRILNR